MRPTPSAFGRDGEAAGAERWLDPGAALELLALELLALELLALGPPAVGLLGAGAAGPDAADDDDEGCGDGVVAERAPWPEPASVGAERVIGPSAPTPPPLTLGSVSDDTAAELGPRSGTVDAGDRVPEAGEWAAVLATESALAPEAGAVEGCDATGCGR